MHTYPMEVAGLHRDLPICKVTDDLYIGAFIVFGDAELTEACAREMLKLEVLEGEEIVGANIVDIIERLYNDDEVLPYFKEYCDKNIFV